MEVQELLEDREISFAQKGNDFVVRCLNSEHADRHPSMRIDKISGIFNCFSCGFKGNIFNYFGEKPDQRQLQRELLKKKIKLKRAETIGLTMPKNSIPYIGNWRDINPKTYKKFKAFQNHSKEFIGRIVFPITNYSGDIAAFNGRHTTGGTPKYMITPHGAKLPLFPVVKPIKGSIILVEGIFDMLNLHDKGLPNAVCCFGTNNVTEEKLSILKMQGVNTVNVFFDGDEPGQRAAKNVKAIGKRIDMFVINIYLKDTDPGELTDVQVDKLRKKLY
jgi:DNA primase